MTPPQLDTVTVTLNAEGTIARLTLNRPAQRNAINTALMRDLIQAAAWLDAQLDIRVVVLSGNGPMFCPGADLRDPPLAESYPETQNAWIHRREIGQLGRRMADAIEGLRAVTIAQVHGAAVGGGLVLLLTCDFRLVADGTRMSLPEVDLGVPLAWGGVPRLIRDIGPVRAKDLILTCRAVSPDEARDIGLIHRVLPPDQLAAHTDQLADTLARKPAVPVAITKEHVNAIANHAASAHMAFADGDTLLAVSRDPEMQRAAMDYVTRKMRRR